MAMDKQVCPWHPVKEDVSMKKTAFCILLLFLTSLTIDNTAIFAEESRYKIGPGDSIEISVWKDETLTRQMIVPPRWYYRLPSYRGY